MSHLLLQGHGTTGFLTYAQRVITTPWQCNMCFKQRVIKEFPVAEKASGTNIHKQFKIVHGVNAVDKRTVHQWASITAGSEKGLVDLSDNTVFETEKG